LKIAHHFVDSGRSHLSSLRIIDSPFICPMKGQAETRGNLAMRRVTSRLSGVLGKSYQPFQGSTFELAITR